MLENEKTKREKAKDLDVCFKKMNQSNFEIYFIENDK